MVTYNYILIFNIIHQLLRETYIYYKIKLVGLQNYIIHQLLSAIKVGIYNAKLNFITLILFLVLFGYQCKCNNKKKIQLNFRKELLYLTQKQLYVNN